VPEDSQRNEFGNQFEGFEVHEPGQLPELDVLRQKNAFARFARIQQIFANELGWPGGRVGRATRGS
jgi:hypothetical protein